MVLRNESDADSTDRDGQATGLPHRRGGETQEDQARVERQHVATPLPVLVVEDNRDAARSLELLLKLIGCEVRVAFDGSSALALLPEFTPRAAILDIGLPDFDGYELARRIRDQRLPAPVTLIALTGWGEEEDRRNSAEAGFDHHLTKPVRFEELSELLERLKRR